MNKRISFKCIVITITMVLITPLWTQEYSLREQVVGHWQMPREYYPSESCCPHITMLDIIISQTTSVMTFRGNVIGIFSLSQFDDTLYGKNEEGWANYSITNDTLTYSHYRNRERDTTVFRCHRVPKEFALLEEPDYETDIVGSWSSTDTTSEIRTLSFLKDDIIDVLRSDSVQTKSPFLLRGATLFFNASEYSVSLLGDTLTILQRDSTSEEQYVKLD